MFVEPMINSNFRAHPVGFEEYQTEIFVKTLLDFNVDLLKKTFGVRFYQADEEKALGIVWRMIDDPFNFQMNGYSGRSESTFSVIFLDCEVTSHEFALSVTPTIDGDYGSHVLTMSYREHVRFGSNGSLVVSQTDKVSDADRMLAKLLLKSPLGHL